MTLKFINNTTKQEWTFDVFDVNDSRMFYHFDIALPEGMPDGEYSYILLDNGKTKASGLLQVGDFIPDNNTYTAQTQNGYIAYNPD